MVDRKVRPLRGVMEGDHKVGRTPAKYDEGDRKVRPLRDVMEGDHKVGPLPKLMEGDHKV